jgi:glycosyltransferase involved in cell wall biosynthesis
MAQGAGPGGGTIAVIPAFNEAGSIGRVVREALELEHPPDLLVIDDGSTDGTSDAARRAGATVLRLPFNCGIGGAVQTGLRFAARRGYDYTVRIDGDGQHDPRMLRSLLGPLERGEADFVVGSRFLDRQGFQSSAPRRAGVRWFCTLLRVVCGLHLTDPTSGLWAANRRAMALLADTYASDYPEVDALVRLSRNGCTLIEVPTSMRPRSAGGSSIGPSNAAYYMLKVTVALLIVRLDRR